MGYYPFSGLYHDIEFSIVTENGGTLSRHGFPCRDIVLRLGSLPSLGVRNGHACVAEMHK